MAKVKISADTVLTILKGIMEDEDINCTIADPSAPKEWKGKTLQEVLNVDYYTFKHRPIDTEIVVEELMQQGKEVDELEALKRAFCILSLNSTERVFSKTNDIVTVSVSLEYWIQTEKIKLLEDMVEDIIVESTGIRIPVKIGNEERQVILAIGNLQISELQEATEFGEMAVCELEVDLMFYPKATSMSDYKVEFAVVDEDTNTSEWVEVPCSSISFSKSMTQKAVPNANKPKSVGNINLSSAKAIVLVFDGYKNKFIDKLSNDTLLGDLTDKGTETEDQDNNESIILRITRDDVQNYYNCVIKDHTITVQENTGNETHSLTLTKRGIKDGTT